MLWFSGCFSSSVGINSYKSPYTINTDKAYTPRLSTTIPGHRPIIKQITKNKTITATVVVGTVSDLISKSSGLGLRNIA